MTAEHEDAAPSTDFAGLKYVNTDVVFQEIPDEVTLAINISNCPNRCVGCHSSYLQEDIGEKLTGAAIDALIAPYSGLITCVSFMGGDIAPDSISAASRYVKIHYPQIKTGWYSGRANLPKDMDISCLDYIKLGPYIREYGPLNKPTTNQRMYRNEGGELKDVTEWFWHFT